MMCPLLARRNHCVMLIALLLVLGVNLIVVLALIVYVVARRRWLKRQSGAFVGAIRVSAGEVDRLGAKWKRGSGRWVHDVLVWSKATLMLTNHLLPVDSLSGERQADAGEIKRLGDGPVIIELMCGDATIAVGTKPEHRALAMGPFTRGA